MIVVIYFYLYKQNIWNANTCQPDLVSLMKTAKLLEVEVADLLGEDNIDWQDERD